MRGAAGAPFRFDQHTRRRTSLLSSGVYGVALPFSCVGRRCDGVEESEAARFPLVIRLALTLAGTVGHTRVETVGLNERNHELLPVRAAITARCRN